MAATKGEQSVNDNIDDVSMMSDSAKRIEAQEMPRLSTGGVCPRGREYARRDGLKRFYILRASEEVCP